MPWSEGLDEPIRRVIERVVEADYSLFAYGQALVLAKQLLLFDV